MENNNIFRFQSFPVYIESRELRKELKKLSKEKFSKEENFILKPQLWRALDSVLLNIAEGTDRRTDKDFSHFLNTSLGSLFEVVACLDCALDDGYIKKEEYNIYFGKADNIARQLKAFMAKIRKDNYK